MTLKINWLQSLSACALTLVVAAMPLSASAQTKKHHSTKKHKTAHTTKAHKKTVHHKRKGTTAKHADVQVERAEAAPAVREVQPATIVPAQAAARTAYDEATWRGMHPDWDGQYHFQDGKYYYDQEFKYAAQIPNDFNSIVARFGGVAILENDPTLVFTGDSGQPYPILEYNADRYKSDKRLKLKSAFFGRAYFWRDGSRYDRKMIVDDTGARCFQFVKHP